MKDKSKTQNSTRFKGNGGKLSKTKGPQTMTSTKKAAHKGASKRGHPLGAGKEKKGKKLEAGRKPMGNPGKLVWKRFGM